MKVRLLLLAVVLVLACMPLACDSGEESSPVTTVIIFNMHGGQATLEGHLDTMLAASSVDVWFSVTTPDGNPVLDTPKKTMSAPGEFSDDVTGLSSNTPYEFCAMAKGDSWDKWRAGEKIPFTIPG